MGQVDLVRALLEGHADPDLPSSCGPPLLTAARGLTHADSRHGHPGQSAAREIVALLLRHGAFVEAPLTPPLAGASPAKAKKKGTAAQATAGTSSGSLTTVGAVILAGRLHEGAPRFFNQCLLALPAPASATPVRGAAVAPPELVRRGGRRRKQATAGPQGQQQQQQGGLDDPVVDALLGLEGEEAALRALRVGMPGTAQALAVAVYLRSSRSVVEAIVAGGAGPDDMLPSTHCKQKACQETLGEGCRYPH